MTLITKFNVRNSSKGGKKYLLTGLYDQCFVARANVPYWLDLNYYAFRIGTPKRTQELRKPFSSLPQNY